MSVKSSRILEEIFLKGSNYFRIKVEDIENFGKNQIKYCFKIFKYRLISAILISRNEELTISVWNLIKP